MQHDRKTESTEDAEVFMKVEEEHVEKEKVEEVKEVEGDEKEADEGDFKNRVYVRAGTKVFGKEAQCPTPGGRQSVQYLEEVKHAVVTNKEGELERREEQSWEKFKPGQAKPDIPFQMKNVATRFEVMCKLDLEQILLKTRNSEYNKKRFPALVLRLRQPIVSAQIFANGKCCICGARTTDAALKASRKVVRILKKLGFPAQLRNWRISNILGTFDLGFPIRLEGIANRYSSLTTYEPECFPALIVQLYNPRAGVTAFVSGKVIVYGAKSVEIIYEAFNRLYPTFLKYRKEVPEGLLEKVAKHKLAQKKKRRKEEEESKEEDAKDEQPLQKKPRKS